MKVPAQVAIATAVGGTIGVAATLAQLASTSGTATYADGRVERLKGDSLVSFEMSPAKLGAMVLAGAAGGVVFGAVGKSWGYSGLASAALGASLGVGSMLPTPL